MLEKKSLDQIHQLIEVLEKGFDLPEYHTQFPVDFSKMEEILVKTAEKMQDNYPYFHPLYAGQMLKPPHPIARMAYMLSLWINPNNHALDGGKASSAMEKEVVRDLAAMVGWKEHLGHLTGGGTMANLEALWVSGKEQPGGVILGSEQAHYTHSRISAVLGLDFIAVNSDKKGRMDISDLKTKLQQHKASCVIATLGTTGIGALDPLDKIIELREQYGFRIHVDAAYGGYFGLSSNLEPYGTRQFDHIQEADSLVIDPHKHGMQPYGCGCVLFRDPEMAKHYLHDSPYTYYTSDELHLGEISLECSRPGASAVALWATHQLLPPIKKGEYASRLEDCRNAAKILYAKLQEDERVLTWIEPELDIVVWAIQAPGTQKMSDLAQEFFDKAERNQLFLSLYKVSTEKIPEHLNITIDSETLVCLRSCLMKPEHLSWMDEIWSRIDRTLTEL